MLQSFQKYLQTSEKKKKLPKIHNTHEILAPEMSLKSKISFAKNDFFKEQNHLQFQENDNNCWAVLKIYQAANAKALGAYVAKREMSTCRVAWTEHHTPILLLVVPRAEGEASGVSVSVFELKLQKMNTIPSHSHHISLSVSLFTFSLTLFWFWLIN